VLEQETLRALGLSDAAMRSRFRISIEADLRERWTDAIAAATADTPMDVEVYDEGLDSPGQPDVDPTIVITTRADAPPGFRVLPLGESRFDAVATPEFIERWGGARPWEETFAAAPVVVVRGREERHRTFSSSIGLNVSKSMTVVSSTASAVAFLLTGGGWGLVPRVNSAQAVRLGRLHRISTAFIAQPYFLWVGGVSSPGLEAITARLRAAAETAFGADRTGIAQGGLSDETA
jgi:LysR family transcriptional regulator (chromosome initiation inhibitor)